MPGEDFPSPARVIRRQQFLPSTSITRLSGIAVLAKIDGGEIIAPTHPLGVTIAEVHAGSLRPMIVFGIRPIVVTAAQTTTAGIIGVQH